MIAIILVLCTVSGQGQTYRRIEKVHRRIENLESRYDGTKKVQLYMMEQIDQLPKFNLTHLELVLINLAQDLIQEAS